MTKAGRTLTPRNWKMPEWMQQFAKLINNTGGNRIEELYNDDGTNSNVFNNAPLALICVAVKSQVDLLLSLHKLGLLNLAHDDLVKALEEAIAVASGLDRDMYWERGTGKYVEDKKITTLRKRLALAKAQRATYEEEKEGGAEGGHGGLS